MTFMSYLLTDPACYGISKTSAGSMVGTLSFYAYLVCFIFDLGLGTIMDTFGRKIPIILGLAIAAGSLIAMPYGYYVYPNLLIFRYVQKCNNFIEYYWQLAVLQHKTHL